MKMKHAVRPHVGLILIGSVVLLVSWIVQNHYRATAGASISALEQSQILIAIEEGRSTQWQIRFHEEAEKVPPDSSMLAFAALKVTGAEANLLGWAECYGGGSRYGCRLDLTYRRVALSCVDRHKDRRR